MTDLEDVILQTLRYLHVARMSYPKSKAIELAEIELRSTVARCYGCNDLRLRQEFGREGLCSACHSTGEPTDRVLRRDDYGSEDAVAAAEYFMGREGEPGAIK